MRKILGQDVRRNGWYAVLVILALPTTYTCAAQAEKPQPQIGRLRAHVATLASSAFEGRPPGHEPTIRYIRSSFQDHALADAFPDGPLQHVEDRRTGQRGTNVAAILVGTDPVLSERFIILGAHHDHLGTRAGVCYPGADDNASAVAMLLETARCLSRTRQSLRRSVLFVAFDLEEAGLVGSTAFCQSPPIPLDRVDLFLTADMLGRSLAGVCPRRVFGFGTEYAPDLIALVKRAAGDQTSIRVELIGSDLLLADRSDYGPFRRRRIPFLFFSTGENPHYHKPTDRSESIDYEQLEAASRLVCDLVRIAATTETLPRWGEPAVPPPGEAGAVRQVFQDLLEHRNKMNLPNYQQIMMERAIEMIDVAESERRALTPKERARMLRVAQLVLYTAL